MSYLDRIRACNRHDLSHFRAFRVAGRRIGWVKHETAAVLARHAAVFAVTPADVSLREHFDSFEARSRAVEDALDPLFGREGLPSRRGESLPVVGAWGEEPLLRLDRAAVPYFGVPAFGVHVNGFVHGEGGLRIWVARRSHTVHVDPGKLDHLVAGGQPMGLGLRENVAKECAEEAGLGEELVARARPTGIVTYRFETESGLKNDTIFTWDLELPADFRPVNQDGEVDAFELWTAARVLETVRDTDRFKFNVGPVLIDFALRHGLLEPDEPDYVAIVKALRV